MTWCVEDVDTTLIWGGEAWMATACCTTSLGYMAAAQAMARTVTFSLNVGFELESYLVAEDPKHAGSAPSTVYRMRNPLRVASVEVRVIETWPIVMARRLRASVVITGKLSLEIARTVTALSWR